MSNGEILSEAEVEFLLSSAVVDEEQAGPAPTFDEQTVTMRGDLEQINLADIFQTLAMSKMEGVLRLRNPLDEHQVHCHDGFVRLLVPNRIVTRRLGQRLLQAGLVNAEQLREALATQRTDRRPIGVLLVEGGAVAQETIDEIVGRQVAEDLFALFTWRHGSFEFFKGGPDVGVKGAFAACPEFEVNSLLLEVARRSDEWESIFAAINGLDDVPFVVAQPGPDFELGDVHRSLLHGVDGRTRYREIAEHTTFGLFEVARAARDLVAGGVLANLAEQDAVTLAEQHAEAGDKKRALVLLQTLRDRSGERDLAVLQGMAKVLERCSERRLAGALLLEAAQRQTEPEQALNLARAAQALCPHDATTLSFLRTVLIAHAPANSAELEATTLALIDALIEADLVPTALEIIEDARRTGSAQPSILLREVRARQKSHDATGACKVLEELAQLHDERGETKSSTEAWAALLRLDRSRKDVRKLLANRARTRWGKSVRVAAAVAVTAMVGGMGAVFWQQHTFGAAVSAADQEIAALLQSGDRAAARARFDHWCGVLGECEPIDDLRNRITFAEAAEAVRRQKLMRTRVNASLTAAAELLGKGELRASLAAYAEIAREPAFANEVADVITTRLDALVAEIGRVGKGLAGRLPPPPDELLDRRDLLRNMAELQRVCTPALLRAVDELVSLAADKTVSESLGAELLARVHAALADGRDGFARAKELAVAYHRALERNDQQRQLDPLFKAALDAESAFDFAGALARYRELERQPATEGELRAHFRDRVARNATIVKLTDALRAATEAGDFATARQQLRALRLSFPDVPFDRLVRVPLHVDSQPRGARVLAGEKELGRTPLVLSRVPAETLAVTLVSDGFEPAATTVTGDDVGAWIGYLLATPDATIAHDSMIEVPPLLLDGTTVLVDRSGNVTARTAAGTGGWTFRSGDLSGLLSAPVLHGDRVLVGSLDGDLRAIDARTGAVAWSLPDLPTETPMLPAGDLLVVATTSRALHVVDLQQRTTKQIDLQQNVVGTLHRHGTTVLALGERGRVDAFEVPGLARRWHRELSDTQSPLAVVVGDLLVYADDRGSVGAVALRDGEVRWSKHLDHELLGAPTTDGRDVLLASHDRIVRLDAATGAERSVQTPPESTGAGGALVVGNRVVVPLREGGMQVYELGTLTPLYRIRADKKSRALVQGSRLYVVDGEHRIQVFHKLR